jgi:hypothetical protein
MRCSIEKSRYRALSLVLATAVLICHPQKENPKAKVVCGLRYPLRWSERI